MSDFTVNIDSTLDLSKAESQMAAFLNKYKSTPLKVDVQLDTKSINIGNLGKQIQGSLNNSVKGIKIKGLEVDAVDFAKQKQKIQNEISNISNEMKKGISNISTKDSSKWATRYVNQQQKEYQKIINAEQKFQSNLQQSQERYKSLKNKDISKYSDTASYAQIKSNLEKIKSLQSDISSLESKNDSESIIKKNSALKEMNSLLGKSETAYNNLVKPIGTFEAMTASNKTTAWIKNNTKAMKKMGATFDSIAQKQANATTKGELEQYNKEFQSLVATANSKGLTGKSWFDEFKRAGGAIAQFTGIYGVLQRIPQTIGSAITELKEMDSILTEISKVSDMTDIQLQKLGKDSFDYASQYGKKVSDYLQGVTEMNRSGFYGQQGIDLANTSVLAQAAGDMNADVANSYLLATNAAYEYAGSAKKLNAVLDGQNMINKMVMLYRNIWLHNWLLSWNTQRWAIGRIS